MCVYVCVCVFVCGCVCLCVCVYMCVCMCVCVCELYSEDPASIFFRCIGAILKHKLVVLSTNQLQFAHKASKLLALKEVCRVTTHHCSSDTSGLVVMTACQGIHASNGYY